MAAAGVVGGEGGLLLQRGAEAALVLWKQGRGVGLELVREREKEREIWVCVCVV